jgi:hypothetical protein
MGVILMCHMHLVTVKVKVDSSLFIKIIVSIKVILVLVKCFSLLQNLSIELPSTFLRRRKEVKRVLYFVPALMGLHDSLSLAVVNWEYSCISNLLPSVRYLAWFIICTVVHKHLYYSYHSK